MNTANRISAALSDDNLQAALGHLKAARALLPFLVNVPNDERNDVPKFGDKSQAFDDKISDYEKSRPDIVPAFSSAAEANKDRALRTQMRTLNAELGQLMDDCFCTELVLGGDLSDHDKLVYANVHFMADNGVPGTQAIYDDLKQRYPAVSRTKATGQSKPA
ncbi:MAG: hypothetical protein ACOYMN_19180 [Roseimicrobium sp.]